MKVPKNWLRSTLGAFTCFLTKETLNTVEESRWARLEGKIRQYRERKREIVRAVRRDKESQVRGVCEPVECHM